MKRRAEVALVLPAANEEEICSRVGLRHTIPHARLGTKINVTVLGMRDAGNGEIVYELQTEEGETIVVQTAEVRYAPAGGSVNAGAAFRAHALTAHAVVGLGEVGDPLRDAVVNALETRDVKAYPYRRAARTARTVVIPGGNGHPDDTLLCWKPVSVEPEIAQVLSTIRKLEVDVVDASGVRLKDVPLVEATFDAHPAAYLVLSPNTELLSQANRHTLVTLTSRAHFVALNADEASILLGEELQPTRKKEQMEALRGILGITKRRKLLVTRGANGAWLAYQGKGRQFRFIEQHAYGLRGKDGHYTTGAGDAFRAAYIAARRKYGCTRRAALAHAARYAAEKILTPGGAEGHPTIEIMSEWGTLPKLR